MVGHQAEAEDRHIRGGRFLGQHIPRFLAMMGRRAWQRRVSRGGGAAAGAALEPHECLINVWRKKTDTCLELQLLIFFGGYIFMSLSLGGG